MSRLWWIGPRLAGLASVVTMSVVVTSCAGTESVRPPRGDCTVGASASLPDAFVHPAQENAPPPPAGAAAATEGQGGHDLGDLAKATQNPVADLISLPFQNNTDFGVGPDDEVRNTLNIQPVVPLRLNADWKVINRLIAPIISQPEPKEGAHAGFLEFTGAGLGKIQERLAHKERQMAVLGARLLEEPKAGVEAAETVKLRHMGEKSILASVAGSVSDGITDVTQWMTIWEGLAPEAAEKDVKATLSWTSTHCRWIRSSSRT